MVEANRKPDIEALSTHEWGPALVLGSLWEKQGIGDLIKKLAHGRRFEFDVERACFAMALHRLCVPGSDLRAFQWISTVECLGFDALSLQHFYRATALLADVRDELEAELSWRDRDLFSLELDLIFIDTTSLYVYTDSETKLRKRGYSRDRRPDLPQFVLCVVVNRHGWPVAWDIFPGNTADCRSLELMVNRLRKRLKIHDVVLVGDRGMISADTIKLLTEETGTPFSYVLGCRNPIEAAKDQAAREAILAKLQETLFEKGPKAIIGNRGYARFVRVAKGSVSINQDAVDADARMDGKFVLATNTSMPAAEVATSYKSLWRVERTFREQKSTLEVRPIYHHRDDTSIGHIVASFLALRLEVDLQRRLDERGASISWPDLTADLKKIHSVLIELEGNRYRLRTAMQGMSLNAFQAAGARIPASVTALDEPS